jgi:AcrR family transcriptional regulator
MPRRSPTPTPDPRAQAPLTRDRVLAVAIDVADREGIESVSMRRLGQALGVDPMTLYRHVRDKGDLLDGIVDGVVAGIAIAPAEVVGWKASLRATILGARTIALQHPWVPALLEADRQPGPATLRYLDGGLGILRAAGFSVALGHHALHLLGSRILGFSQDLFDEGDASTRDPELAAIQTRQLAAAFPHLGELAMAVTHSGALGGCDDDAEFLFALDLVLDGLERRHADADPA